MTTQFRRNRKKANSRKKHEHNYLVALEGELKGKKVAADGQVFRCLRCRPLPWREPVAVRAAPGPRDWTPV